MIRKVKTAVMHQAISVPGSKVLGHQTISREKHNLELSFNTVDQTLEFPMPGGIAVLPISTVQFMICDVEEKAKK